MEINIQRNVFEYQLSSILSFRNDHLCLSLKFNCRDEETIFTNIIDFLDLLDNKTIYTIKNKYKLEYKYFDEESQKVISSLYLVRDGLALDGNMTVIPNELLTVFLNLNMNRLYFDNGNYKMKVEFNYGFPKIKLLLDKVN